MALFRAMSTTRGRHEGYARLLDDTDANNGIIGVSDIDHAMLKRATSVPAARMFGLSKKNPNPELVNNLNSKQKKKGKKGEKIHPVFSLFEGKGKKKKMTANPEFSRYIEYLKEGGLWNKN